MKRDGQLAGAEVGPEVPPDLTDCVDDVLTDLLGESRQVLLAETMQILRPIDVLEQAHEVRVKMKSAMFSSSTVAPVFTAPRSASSTSAALAVSCDSAGGCFG